MAVIALDSSLFFLLLHVRGVVAAGSANGDDITVAWDFLAGMALCRRTHTYIGRVAYVVRGASMRLKLPQFQRS